MSAGLFKIGVINLVLTLIFTTPILYFLNAYAPFLIYMSIILIGMKKLNFLPIIFVIKILFSMLLLFYYYLDPSSQINLIALLFSDFFSLIYATLILKYGIENFYKKFYYFGFLSLILYFLLSLFLSNFLYMANPIEGYMQNKRLLFLAEPNWGHSLINELCSFLLILIYAFNLLSGSSKKIHLFIISTLLFMGGSITCLLLLLFIHGIYFFEYLIKNIILKNFINIVILLIVAIFMTNGSLLNDSIKILREGVLKQDISVYNEDYTSGRAELNTMLVNLANENVIFGAGHNHPVMKEGITLGTSLVKGATSESPLRLAGKYGWIYFLITLIMWLTPFIFSLYNTNYRLFFLLSSYAILILGSSNASFSVPQSIFFLFYSPVVFLSIILLSKKIKF